MVKKSHKMASMLLFAMVLTIAGEAHAAALLNRVQHAIKTAFQKHPGVVTQLRTAAYKPAPKIALQPLCSTITTRSLGALSKPAAFLKGTEANQSFIRTFIAPLLVGTGSQRTITTDAAANKIASTEEGPVAKVKLLQGHLTGMPPHMTHATLLHGAMLWELGIIKSLYTLLVTPKIETLENGQTRLVPDTSFKPLGTLLQQIFYLAGGTFAPTKRQSAYANKLTPAALGSLYKAIIDDSITAGFDPQVKKISGGKAKKEESETTRKLFMETLIACKTPSPLNPPHLSATIMMSFFWAKFVIGAERTAQAQENLAAFFQAAIGQDAPRMSTADETKIKLEANTIQRIIDAYSYGLPKPPIQGSVTLTTGHRFPDCGESGIRGFFNAAFYDVSTKQFAIPTTQEGFYDPRLVAFYTEYPTLVVQSSQEARNAWGEVISNRTNLTYNKDGICDLGCTFTNVMCLMAQLAPGIYQKLSSCCTCGKACAWKTTMPTDPAFSAQIKAHFIASPICAQAMLEQIAKHHSLNLMDFEIDTKTNAASWEILRNNTKKCALAYKTRQGHMSCDLHTKPLAQQQILDPVLGAADAVSTELRAPDYIEPLLFAAARMAQQQNFADAYFTLLHIGKDKLTQVQKNVHDWGLMTPESARLVAKHSASPDQKLQAAIQLGLARTCKFLIDLYKISPDIFLFEKPDIFLFEECGATPLMLAAICGKKDVCKVLIQSGANVNAKDSDGTGVLMHAIAKRSMIDKNESDIISIVKILLENGANIDEKHSVPPPDLISMYDDRSGKKSILMEAMNIDLLNLVKMLIDYGADINTTDEHIGNTPLMNAVRNKKADAIAMLLNHGANINAKNKSDKTAFMMAAENGHVHILSYLFDHGANINETTKDGATAFTFAAENGDQNIINFLLEHSASFGNKDTILLYAAGNGNVALITLMLTQGANINAKDSALHCAAFRNKTDALTLLLKHGANIEATTICHNKHTPLLHAVKCGNKEAVAILLEHGADTNARNFDNKTALMLAEASINSNANEIVALLRQHIASKNPATSSGQRAEPIKTPNPANDGAEEAGPPATEAPMHVPGLSQRAYTRFMRILFGP